MLVKKIILTIILLNIYFLANCQANEYFKVEFDAFTPPQKAMIESIEGKTAKNFVMNDINGVSQSLLKFRGNKVVLFFWNENVECSDLLNLCNEMSSTFPKTIFLGLYNDLQSKLPVWFDKNEVKTIILPNATFLGEAVYDAELGTPRIYFIDEYGIVKMVLPYSYFAEFDNIKNALQNFLMNKIH